MTKVKNKEIIVDWLINKIAHESDVKASEIDIDKPIVDYDISSIVALQILEELQLVIGKKLEVPILHLRYCPVNEKGM